MFFYFQWCLDVSTTCSSVLRHVFLLLLKFEQTIILLIINVEPEGHE